MESNVVSVLLIAADAGDADHVARALGAGALGGVTRFDVRAIAPDDATGLAQVGADGVDVLLLDAGASPETALDTVVRARIEAPEVPVILITGATDRDAALGAEALQAGAQDFLARETLGNGLLARVIRYAIERHRLQTTLRQLSLTDELTGLYNRRGLFALAEHHLKLAHRTRGLLVAAVEINALDAVRDHHGRDAAERAALAAATALRESFRASDIIGRIGDDRFAVLVVDATDETMNVVEPRLHARVARLNDEHQELPDPLALTLGIARFDPGSAPTLDVLLAHAAESLDARKRGRAAL